MTAFHVFLSYTSREEEIKWIKPLIDIYCRDLWKWAQSNGIEIFYDDFTMQKRRYSDLELEKILRDTVNRSHLMTAFLSLAYVESEWCRFEYLVTRTSREPVVHAIVWKDFPLDILPSIFHLFPLGEALMPEEGTDVRYLHQNPTLEGFEQAARVCVRDSIKLIRRYYPI
jgi:hypothetical protein